MNARQCAFQYPTYSIKEVERCSLLLLMPPEKTATLDVMQSDNEQFFMFVKNMLEVLYESATTIKQDIFDDATADQMDLCGRFFVINQLARLDKVRELGLIERKTPVCASCLKYHRLYVPADLGNGRYCKPCFISKMKKAGCGVGDVVMPPGSTSR